MNEGILNSTIHTSSRVEEIDNEKESLIRLIDLHQSAEI